MAFARRGDDQYMLRFPEGMRDEIAAAAKANGRSMNSEIIARLEAGSEALRDRFAIAALPSVVTVCAGDTYQIATYQTPAAYFSAKAYEVADAMLAARKGGDA